MSNGNEIIEAFKKLIPPVVVPKVEFEMAIFH